MPGPGNMQSILSMLNVAWTPYELQSGRLVYVTPMAPAAREAAVLRLARSRWHAEIEPDPIDTHDVRLRIWPAKPTI